MTQQAGISRRLGSRSAAWTFAPRKPGPERGATNPNEHADLRRLTRSSAAALQTKCARSAPSTRRCLQQRCVMCASRASGRSPTLRPTAVSGAHLAPVPLGGCDQRTRAVRAPARPCRRSPIPHHRRMHRSISFGWWPMRHNARFCSGRPNRMRAQRASKNARLQQASLWRHSFPRMIR